MSSGHYAPVLKKQNSSSAILKNAATPKANEWFCHCCIARNDILVDSCRVCGRGRSYADAPHLPLHDTGKYILRPDQVGTLLPGHRIHDSNDRNWTALHSCAAIGNRELVEELLNQGSELEATTIEGYTPLHLAVYSGSIETVSVIVMKKANINAKTFFEQNTPLHIAIQEGWRSLVQYLIDVGADVNIVNAVGRSPLHVAATTGRVDIGNILLHNKANFKEMDFQGWTPQQVAEYHNHFDFQEILMRCGLKDSQYKITEIQKGDWDNELWGHVVKGRRRREEELLSSEVAYDVSSVKSYLAIGASQSLQASSWSNTSSAGSIDARLEKAGAGSGHRGSVTFKGDGRKGSALLAGVVIKPPANPPGTQATKPPGAVGASKHTPVLTAQSSSGGSFTSSTSFSPKAMSGTDARNVRRPVETPVRGMSEDGACDDNISVISELSKDGTVSSNNESKHAAAARRNLFS
jgi:hypothetical protein